MTQTAEVVVVGGGILGCSTALHLLDEGVSEVVVVERDNVAQATSAAGAGFVGTWAGGMIPSLGEEELAIERFAIEFYRELAGREHDIGFRQDGCLWVAVSEGPLPFIEAIATHGTVPDTRVVGPDEIEEITGVVSAAAVLRGVFHPSSAQVSAQPAALAIAAEVRARGGRIETRRPVSGLVVDAGRIRAVETLHGRIATDTVVLAAGAWTNELLRPHADALPMAPMVATRIVTEPMGIPGTMPTLYLKGFASAGTNSLWLREEKGGLLWGGGFEAEPRLRFVDAELMPERLDGLPMDGILELQRAALAAARALPQLGLYRSFTFAHGTPTYTADRRGLVGEVPGVAGLHVVAGCNETGITHGPGWGKALAEKIVRGASVLANLDAWRIDRFGDGYPGGDEILAEMATHRHPSDSAPAVSTPSAAS